MPLVDAKTLDALLAQYGVPGVSIAVLVPANGDAVVQTQTAGAADRERGVPLFDSTWLEIASLSKTIAGAYACDYFESRGMPMRTTAVNPLLRAAGSQFQLRAAAGKPAEWADQVMLAHLLDHTGLGMHYVNGVPLSHPFPPVLKLISGTDEAPAPYGYASIDLTREPGTQFSYSGGGFLVLQHLLEMREGRPIAEIFATHFQAAGTAVSLGLSFEQQLPGKHYATGYRDTGDPVDGGRLSFPPLAAGGLGTPAALLDWLRQLSLAYKRPEGCGPISHATAVLMLTPAEDLGSEAFMRARMGLSVFVFDVSTAQGTHSRWMLHQAANDGFRGLYLVCFDGPDAVEGPRGFVILCNGDNNGMFLNCAVAREVLRSDKAFTPPLQGLDWASVPSMDGFSTSGLKQEEIVNLGLKNLVLDAFVGHRG